MLIWVVLCFCECIYSLGEMKLCRRLYLQEPQCVNQRRILQQFILSWLLFICLLLLPNMWFCIVCELSLRAKVECRALSGAVYSPSRCRRSQALNRAVDELVSWPLLSVQLRLRSGGASCTVRWSLLMLQLCVCSFCCVTNGNVKVYVSTTKDI